MSKITQGMLAIIERLAEMFPNSSYQSRLDAYLSTKGITDSAQLENYIREFNYSQKEQFL
jgi:ArsR family metal-binding transcriptional regulator